MYQSVSKYVDFITKNYLTQDQFLFMYLIKFKEYEEIKKFKEAFPKLDGSMIGEEYKKDLIDRGFIKQIGEDSKPSDFELTEKFTHLFMKNHFFSADQVWEAYPSYVSINGKNIPLTTMDKYQFANLYAERIKYSIEEHKEVLLDIKYGRDKDLISMSIEKFVQAEMWTRLRQLRKGEQKIPVISLTDSF